MAKQNHISFEEWVTWMFDRQKKGWEWKIDENDYPWLQNTSLLTEYFIRLHESPSAPLNKFSNEQIGWGLWNLYGSFTGIGSPYYCRHVDSRLRNQAIRSVAVLIREFAVKRLPCVETTDGDALQGAVYMFWDIAPIWPHQPTSADRALLEVCLAEMEAALRVDHPIAAYHALHGLGHFEMLAPEQTTAIIDRWLATSPRIGAVVRKYAHDAHRGAVQ